jgi:hypothetical protein
VEQGSWWDQTAPCTINVTSSSTLTSEIWGAPLQPITCNGRVLFSSLCCVATSVCVVLFLQE